MNSNKDSPEPLKTKGKIYISKMFVTKNIFINFAHKIINQYLDER